MNFATKLITLFAAATIAASFTGCASTSDLANQQARADACAAQGAKMEWVNGFYKCAVEGVAVDARDNPANIADKFVSLRPVGNARNIPKLAN